MELTKRYIPSNGSEGMIFIDNFCNKCFHEKFMHTQNDDDKICEILTNSIGCGRPCFDKDLNLDGWEWFRDKDFSKVDCMQYKHWDWGNDPDDLNEPPEPPIYDPNQLLMVSFDENIDKIINPKLVEVEK